MSHSSISVFRTSGLAVAYQAVGRLPFAQIAGGRGPSPRGTLSPCLGLAVLGSTILWAGILSIGALLVA